MRRYSSLGIGLAALCIAVPASATITIFDTPGAVQPDENVLFQAGSPNGATALGITNQTDTIVAFLGNENLSLPASGQARITTTDGGLSFLSFGLQEGGLGFTAVEFNIFGTGRTAESTTLNFTDQFGNVFGDTFTLNNGQNFFSALAIDGQFITNVSIALNGGSVPDIRQIRIGGIGLTDDGTGSVVPEPSVWALLIGGFGMVGVASRRRRRPVQITA